MSRRLRSASMVLPVVLLGGSFAFAAPAVDGTRDVDYGSALSVQQTPTGFGDSNTGAVDTANGSELDAAYGTVANGRLYIFLSGNLETNFNKVDIFIDSASGGTNVLGTLSNNQGNFNNMTGLTFDTGFAPDHWVSATAGNSPTSIFVDYGNLQTQSGFFAGSTTPGSNGTLTGGNGGPPILFTFNDSNTTGVTSSTAPNDAASVTTGMELSMSLADLGYTSGNINVSAFINNGDHNYLSNQVLGSLPSGTGNLGGDGAGNFTGNASGINFNNFAGNQFFTVSVPEPGSIGLISLVGLALVSKRRR